MWTASTEIISGGRARRTTLSRNGVAVTFGQVWQRWQKDDAFCDFMNNQLAACPFAAFKWELPALTRASTSRNFECVMLEQPGLARRADVVSFSDQFAACPAERSVISFPNLGGDAQLVVPRPMSPATDYAHLAVFLRTAPLEHQRELWRVVGRLVEERLGEQPLWLSTAGMGVAWLHVRLDSRPKYIGHVPYTKLE